MEGAGGGAAFLFFDGEEAPSPVAVPAPPPRISAAATATAIQGSADRFRAGATRPLGGRRTVSSAPSSRMAARRSVSCRC
jgi:hypothetical protein